MTEALREVLEAAADLLDKPGAWAQHDFARDAAGREVNWFDDSAVCWCARGAIAVASAAYHDYQESEIDRIWTNAAGALGFDALSEIECWNDDPRRTQAEVVAALRQAAFPSPAGGEHG